MSEEKKCRVRDPDTKECLDEKLKTLEKTPAEVEEPEICYIRDPKTKECLDEEWEMNIESMTEYFPELKGLSKDPNRNIRLALIDNAVELDLDEVLPEEVVYRFAYDPSTDIQQKLVWYNPLPLIVIEHLYSNRSKFDKTSRERIKDLYDEKIVKGEVS